MLDEDIPLSTEWPRAFLATSTALGVVGLSPERAGRLRVVEHIWSDLAVPGALANELDPDPSPAALRRSIFDLL